MTRDALLMSALLAASAVTPMATSAADPVVPAPARAPAPATLHDQLLGESLALIEARRQAFERIKTADDARRWQAERRRFFIEQIGGLPEPVRPASRITGTITGDGYRIEKVILESRPHHHVTGLMVLPDHVPPPYATLLVCCGHSYEGKAAEGYQKVCILAARNGLAAFCFDPVGQGERYQTLRAPPLHRHEAVPSANQRLAAIQMLTPRLPPHYDPVQEHTLIGIGPILLGSNTAHYRVWDAMRCIDYLVSRTDVDPRRIGVTGNSGGGTEAAYLAALDDRIAAAAPGCFLTSYRRLLETSGPQDAEQNIHGQLRAGLDEADYVALAAPRPVQILAATRDATFDITGTWELFREAKRFYAVAGHPERVDLVEVDDVHGFTVHLREAAVRWMRRWLIGVDDAIVEPELAVHAPRELQCTPEGQVLLLDGERSVFDLTADALEQLAAARREATVRGGPAELRDRIAAVLHIDREHEACTVEPPAAAVDGRTERLSLLRPGRVSLAVTFRRPDKPTGELVLFVSAAGADVPLDAEPVVGWLAQGKTVAAIDLSGYGAGAIDPRRFWATEVFGPGAREYYLAYLNGRSLVGLRTEDLLAAAGPLARHLACERVHVRAVGGAAIPALHAAALRPELFASTTLAGSIGSWEEVSTTPVPENQLTNTVHGALVVYDLPDLVGLAGGPRRVTIVKPVDARGTPR
jgi:dienelactone hydrolase